MCWSSMIPWDIVKHVYTRFAWFEKSPEYISIEAEEQLNKDDKRSITLESEVTKAIKYMRRKKDIGDDNIPADFSRSWKIIYWK